MDSLEHFSQPPAGFWGKVKEQKVKNGGRGEGSEGSK